MISLLTSQPRDSLYYHEKSSGGYRRTVADFPYTTVPGKIETLLAKIQEVGVPEKATHQWLKTVGFMSSNDRSLVSILKALGFIDSTGKPTPRWSEYRGANHKHVLGHAVRDGFADLFKVYADADKRSQSDLEHVFRTSSSAGKQVIAKTTSTFKSLVKLAEFATPNGHADGSAPVSPDSAPAEPASPSVEPALAHGPSLHIDIQVHISPDASTDQIEHVFASMAKHLYRGKTSD